jgi:hypothetical protein
MLVGQYAKGIYNLKTRTNQYSDINDCSWMLKWDKHHIIMNNEYNNELFVVNKTSNHSTKLLFDTQKVSGPVYLSRNHNQLYVACYGNAQGKLAGVCVYNIYNINMVDKIQPHYITLPDNDEHHIHCVNQFNNRILAIDLGGYDKGGNIYELKNNQLIKLFNFGTNIKPRHFTPINQNQIGIITESKKVGCYILSSDDNNFNIKNKIIFNNNNQLGIQDNITGAEIQFYKNHLYVSIRTYKKTFGEADNEITNGIIVKLNLDLNILNHYQVGKEPRFFNIKNDIIYVSNQESNTISKIYLNNNQEEQEEYPNMTKPNFILFEDFTNNLLNVETNIQHSIHKYKTHI